MMEKSTYINSSVALFRAIAKKQLRPSEPRNSFSSSCVKAVYPRTSQPTADSNQKSPCLNKANSSSPLPSLRKYVKAVYPRTSQPTADSNQRSLCLNKANSSSPLPSLRKLIREIEGLIDDDPFIKDCISDLLKRPDETFLNDLKSVLKCVVSAERVTEKSVAKITENTKKRCQKAIESKDLECIRWTKQNLAEIINKLEAVSLKLEQFEVVFQKLSKLNQALIPQLKIHLKPRITVNQKENPKVEKVRQVVRFEETPSIRYFSP